MPKFYIFDGAESAVIEADSPLQACFRAIKHRFRSIPVNGFYKVSEQGFETHPDDVVFSSSEVVQALLDMMYKAKQDKKPKNDEDKD